MEAKTASGINYSHGARNLLSNQEELDEWTGRKWIGPISGKTSKQLSSGQGLRHLYLTGEDFLSLPPGGVLFILSATFAGK